jgi:Cu/Ag efflux pump CusA
VVPLMLSHGPGAEVRRAMGVTVFSGMIGVTVSGLMLTPVFYVALQLLVSRDRRQRTAHEVVGLAAQVPSEM